MKKLMKRKNNKGFSLVELIVVVLIMGIIAVALAPQVMKWVDKARTNTDESQKATLTSSIQIAYADYQSTSGSITSTVSGTLSSKSQLDTDLSSVSGLAAKIDEVLGGKYPTKNAGGNFTFTIDANGKVTVN